MRGAATQSMSDIVEERQQSRCPPAAAPLRAAARRPAGFVARSSHTAPGIARRSRLASGPGGLQQNVKLFLREPLETGIGSPADETASARAAQKRIAVNDQSSARKNLARNSPDTPSFVQAVVDAHVMGAGGNGCLRFGIKEHDIGITSYSNGAFPGKESEHLC